MNKICKNLYYLIYIENECSITIWIIRTKKENSCKEGTIAGGAIGAGIGLATSKGKDRFWAVPAAGTIGALVGCQIDGG